jgi:uncharacterized protein YqjF (DUF2071 family)
LEQVRNRGEAKGSIALTVGLIGGWNSGIERGKERPMREYLIRTSQSPRPLPSGRWQMTQRWNDLLFAHWPVSSAMIAALLPEGLEPDQFQGSAWLGVVPFWLDRIKFRGIPALPGMRSFPDLVAVALAHTFFHLPYHWAEMRLEQRSEREFSFYSRRRLSDYPIIFKARYRGLGPTRKLAEGGVGTLEHFLMERSSLFTRNRSGQAVRSSLHHVPWPLEDAEADIERNDLAKAIGIELPEIEPVLHYSRRLAVYVWPRELVRPAIAGRPVTVAATPLG